MVVSHIFGIFTPKIGEDEPILTSIFFGWVGSTTNQAMFTAILGFIPGAKGFFISGPLRALVFLSIFYMQNDGSMGLVSVYVVFFFGKCR